MLRFYRQNGTTRPFVRGIMAATTVIAIALSATSLSAEAPFPLQLSGKGPAVDIRHPCFVAVVQKNKASATQLKPSIQRCLKDAEAGDVSALFGAGLLLVTPSPRNDDWHDPPKGMAYFERAASEHGLPAAHYMLGNLFVSGEAGPQDDERGRRYLETAVSLKNIAAMDVLADLLIRARGGPADTQRALALYERASENRFEDVTIKLALLHQSGIGVPRDYPKAKEILARAAKAGQTKAARLLEFWETSEQKVKNVVTVPAAGSNRVKLVTYRGYDMPPLPASVGFSTDFAELLSRPAEDNSEIIEDLRSRMHELPTPYLFELARRVAMTDPREGFVLHSLATIRLGYDVARCSDRSAGQALTMWRNLMDRHQPLLRTRDQTFLKDTLRKAFELEENFDDGAAPWWVCFSGPKAIEAARSNIELENWHVPTEDWPKIRAEIRSKLRALR